MSIYRAKTKQEVYLTSLLYDSIDDNNFRAVRSLLCEKGANPNFIVPTKGISPFHLAVGIDDCDFALKVTCLILEFGGDPNVRSEDGLTPVHIASAWNRLDILKLLMRCGGDAELRDANWMTPVQYALKENLPDCVDLLRDHLPDKYEAMHEDLRDCYQFSFDKLLVNNGNLIGEYEIDEETARSINADRPLLDLVNQPEPDHTKLVLNWFETHVDEAKVDETFTVNRPNSTDEDFVSYESSADESDVVLNPKTLNSTIKKTYKKKRKIERQPNPRSSTPQTSPKSCMVERNPQCSSESGIQTLPCSGNSLSSVKPPETSSDYMTCSGNSILNQNILAIYDASKSLFASDESCNKSCESYEASFVTVSEVYKYEDEQEGIVLYEKRSIDIGRCSESVLTGSISSKMSQLPDRLCYDFSALRQALLELGYPAGPVTSTTRSVYLKKLRELQSRGGQAAVVAATPEDVERVYSRELRKTLRNGDWTSNLDHYKQLETTMMEQFRDPSKKWVEGRAKASFAYLLLDPRKTNNLREEADLKKAWERFLAAIFYVGKGKRNRPFQHLYEARRKWDKPNNTTSTEAKEVRILDIWRAGRGVICLHVFQNIMPVEAYTREAAMISALGLRNLSNKDAGKYYGVACQWSDRDKEKLGAYLLHKAMNIFLNECGSEIYPENLN
ncbi:unnamed protein product [Phyllotreta striolata]|uniref:LEM domain-containing protein n=1 Tax=Phyllotreta striolata TaxID=444603 RepID=A0A9N9XSM2_PHYSR|nr:unnamed protein product [Phyllotreta striolata]